MNIEIGGNKDRLFLYPILIYLCFFVLNCTNWTSLFSNCPIVNSCFPFMTFFAYPPYSF